MTSFTWLDIKTKIWDDLDLEDEDFISASELIGYGNEAIREVIHEMSKLGVTDDYFLSYTNLALVNATSDYTLPTDIFANKIRKLIYDDGFKKYTIRRIKNFENIHNVESTDDYSYRIFNTSSGIRLKLFPTPAESSSTNVVIYYTRNPAAITADASTIDIPEGINFIIQHIKVSCLEKENHPLLRSAKAELGRERQTMVDALTDMVPDEDNFLEGDFSFYEDMN